MNNGLVVLDFEHIQKWCKHILNIGRKNWETRLDRFINTILYISNSKVFIFDLAYQTFGIYLKKKN